MTSNSSTKPDFELLPSLSNAVWMNWDNVIFLGAIYCSFAMVVRELTQYAVSQPGLQLFPGSQLFFWNVDQVFVSMFIGFFVGLILLFVIWPVVVILLLSINASLERFWHPLTIASLAGGTTVCLASTLLLFLPSSEFDQLLYPNVLFSILLGQVAALTGMTKQLERYFAFHHRPVSRLYKDERNRKSRQISIRQILVSMIWFGLLFLFAPSLLMISKGTGFYFLSLLTWQLICFFVTKYALGSWVNRRLAKLIQPSGQMW